MKIVQVRLGKRSYPIYIGVDLENLGQNLSQYSRDIRKTVIVTNKLLSGLYGEILEKSLSRAGYKVRIILVPDGEKYKTLEQAEKLYAVLLKEKVERFSPLIAFGGGVIGDLAGFVAATFLRGIPLVQVPTTLVAQVDSSIGGKVAVNLPEGKNLVGAFYQPSLVWIDLKVLKTLPLSELRNGLAEVIKYAIINNGHLIGDLPKRHGGFFPYLEKNLSDIRHLSSDIWIYIVYHSCRVKAKIVEKDEREETGLRRILNFGHTFGHALETVTKYRVYKHGEAISLGMVLATKIAQELKLVEPEITKRIVDLLERVGLPTKWPKKYKFQKIYPYLEYDKKVVQEKINFVLPVKIGKVIIRDDVPKSIIRKVLDN